MTHDIWQDVKYQLWSGMDGLQHNFLVLFSGVGEGHVDGI